MVDSCTEVGGVPSDDGGGKQGEALGLEWSSPRWPDTSTKSAFDVREWTQRVGKESCWEGNDREESSPMSSNVDAVEIVRSSGKPIRQVANELGIYDSTLGNWVRQDETNRGEREGLTSGERERLRELERENARLRTERELEKTSCGVVGEGVERVMPYRFVDAEVAEGFPVRLVCSVVGVSPSAYYASKQRPQSGPAQLAEDVLVDEIRTIWRQSGGTYGSPRVCAELRRRGRVVNHKRVERLMKGHHIVGFVPRKRRVTTTADTAHRIPDLLRGDFTTAAPDEAWVGDITYIRTRQGFLYLAFVLDLASRRVLGISMAPHMKASLVADALREAIGTRGSQVRGVVFHTDRGSQRPLEPGQYTSRATAQLCRAYGIAQSVGRTGVCWDSAAAESFLGTLKKELVNRNNYRSRHHARLSIRYWIEAWYNPRRLHSTIGQQPPNEWEDNYYHHTAA